MGRLRSFVTTLVTKILILADGLRALATLAGYAAESLRGSAGSFTSRLLPRLTTPEGLRAAFAVARAFWPNLGTSRKIITAYANRGTVLLTRFEDVKEMLRRDEDFAVVYGPRMEKITGGANFFLGMQNTSTSNYTRDVSNMRLAVRQDDVSAIIKPFVARSAEALVRAAPGRIDVPQDLTLRVPAQLLGAYFGTPGPSEAEMIAWTALTFWYLFGDLNADPALDARAMAAASALCAYLDDTIKARKANPTTQEDVLKRCLNMQQAGLPGMDDLGIRNNLVGLLIGAVQTTSTAAVNALDQLLARPEALASAQEAARAEDDALLGRHVFEALRFHPINPILYRSAKADTVIAANTLRAITIPAGTLVLGSNLSAMFDRLKVAGPDAFRLDRPDDNYILWGDGLHKCFGAYINLVTIPGILKPLLKRQGLRRAEGAAGQIDTADTPYPVHLWLEFDPG
jgi:cytochrome P450